MDPRIPPRLAAGDGIRIVAPSRSLAALLLPFLAIGCAAAPTVEGGRVRETAGEEWDRELPSRVQHQCFAETDAESHIPVRVVDDATGEPVAGARIDNWWEADTPHAEPWEDLLERSVVTDRDGRAVLPARVRAQWYYVEAPGYAPLGEMSLDEAEYRLVRGRDITVEVRDWRDRPVPGATVEALLGCGHTPNIRTATAGPDGRLVFRCIDPDWTDLWVRTPGLAGRNEAYWGSGAGGLPVEGGVHVLRTDPGPVLEGLVLRPDGSPAAGAIVGTRQAHRGPWTVAGPDGRFRLVGAQPYDSITAQAPPTDPVPDSHMPPQVRFQSVPGVVPTIRLPVEGRRRQTAEDLAQGREPPPSPEAVEEVRRKVQEAAESGAEVEPVVPPEGPGIRVRVAATAGVLPDGRVRVVAVRDGDGAADEEFPKFKDGVAARAIPVDPGSWTVTAGDRAGLLRPASLRVTVGKGWAEASFVLDANPTWHPRVVERGPDGMEKDLADSGAGTFYLTTDDGNILATPAMDDGGVFDGSIFVPAAGPFAVEFLAEDGREARVHLDGPPSGAGPVLVLPPLAPEVAWIEEDGRPRDFPPERFSVLLPDGKPAAEAKVDILSAPAIGGDSPGMGGAEQRTFCLDGDGAMDCAFDRGDRIVVTAGGEGEEGIVPFVARIEGPGPWTLRWPATEIAVRAMDEAGAPLTEFAVVLSGWDSLDAVDGVVLLRGASSGPLRLWVAAPERRVRDLRLVLVAGEKREVVVRMNPAEPGSER